MARLAGIVAMLGMAVAFVIVIGIVLVVLDAKASNDIVSTWLDVSRWLTTPFHGLFDLENNKTQLAVNWGLAALVYWLVAMLISRLMLRAAGGSSFMRRRRAATH